MEKINTKNLKYIDLSIPIHQLREPVSPEEIVRGVLEEEMVWPIETYKSYVDDTVCQYLKLKTHVKTHIESPWHLNQKGSRLSEFPLEHFVGRMVNFCFDVDPGSKITKNMVEKYAVNDLQKGDIVVFHSTQSDTCDPKKRPIMLPEVAEFFISKEIKVFGLDNSVEIGETIDGKRPHDMFLSSGIPLLEMLTNLSLLSQKVTFICAIPGLIKIQGLDASTTPVVAIEGIEVL